MGKQKTNKSIRDNYQRYCDIIEDEKTLPCSKIILDEDKKSRKDDIKEKSVMTFSKHAPEGICLTIDQNKINDEDFKFSLRYTYLCLEPIFRYDSIGPTHCNSNLPIPIEEQQIPTPHFHKYCSDGKMIAYKTETLKKASQVDALRDITLCVYHFFQEANIKYDKFDLISSPGMINFPKDNSPYDPLENVIFK